MTRKLFAQTAWFETSFRNYKLFSEQFKKWEFNVYDVADASKQRPLTYVLYELLKKYDLLTTFKVRFPATSKQQLRFWTKNFGDKSDLSGKSNTWLQKAISSIFLRIFDCLKCITGWPWLHLGLNQQTNSYFIDNLRDDPGDSGQTVMFMIQASDTNLFTVLIPI